MRTFMRRREYYGILGGAVLINAAVDLWIMRVGYPVSWAFTIGVTCASTVFLLAVVTVPTYLTQRHADHWRRDTEDE